MGRHRNTRKQTEKNFWRFGIDAMKKHGVIIDGKQSSGIWYWIQNNEKRCSIDYTVNTLNGSGWLRVLYTNQSTYKQHDYKIFLTTTRPNYGGLRWWFICPAQDCERRVGVLYLANTFACRHCHNLAYSTQHESRRLRQLSKAQNIYRRLGGDWANDNDDIPPKPKGMHWKTYWMKVEKLEAALGLHMTSMLQWLKI